MKENAIELFHDAPSPFHSSSHNSDEETEHELLHSGEEFPATDALGRELFDANANIPLDDDERAEIALRVEEKLVEIFEILRISRRDPNSRDSPYRLSRMWVNELFAGRYTAPPKITVFPNRKQVDELIISKGITVMSLCSHHWQPIAGECAIGYLPGDYILGLSKFNRIVEWFCRRGQIQEELGEQIADFLESLLKPRALGVVLKSRHYCMIARGVQEPEEQAWMITSVMRGGLRSDSALRHEFLTLISS